MAKFINHYCLYCVRLFALLIAVVLFTATHANAQISVRPDPMWEGYEKTASDIKSDETFVAKALELAEGDRAHAVNSLLQIGWSRIGDDPNHAIRAFNQAWLIEPAMPDIFWGYAIASHIRNDPLAKVNRWFKRTRELMAAKGLPENARLEADQGRVLTERNCHKEARPFFEKALTLDPEYRDAHIGMINVAIALGEKELQDKHQKRYDELVK